jgi:sugar lactone lactonase YvrE
MSGAEPASGSITLVTPDGSAREVADEVWFPNGMAVTPNNSTLIVAESYRSRLTAFDIDQSGDLSNRRVWADLGTDVPDGICMDAEGAIWYADVPNKHCVRVQQGGEVLLSVVIPDSDGAGTLDAVSTGCRVQAVEEYGLVFNTARNA